MQKATIDVLQNTGDRMDRMINFGREINHGPLIRSILISALLGCVSSLINYKTGLMIFLIILLIMLFVYYPSYLPFLYSYWALEAHGITYYDMSSYHAKLKMIFRGRNSDHQFISYTEINSFEVKSENNSYSLIDISTFKNQKQSIFTWLRKPLNLILHLKNNQITLDASWDQLHDSKNIQARLMNVMSYLDKKVQ